MKLGGKFYSRKELERRIGNISQIGGTRHYEFIEGRSKGVSAIEVNSQRQLGEEEIEKESLISKNRMDFSRYTKRW